MNNNKLNRILTYIIVGLVAVIITGTVLGFAQNSENAQSRLIAKGKATNLMPPKETEEVSYFEMGTFRVTPVAEKTDKDEQQNGTVMVISPWIAYPNGDTVFYEEIARKQGLIKTIFTLYFSSRTKSQILSETEEDITSHLIEQINNKLSLGKISNIYFTDYIFLE